MMVPITMMLNHSCWPNCYSFIKDEGYEARALRPGLKNTQCHISYGDFSNQDLVHFYGFSLKDNVDDYVVMSFDHQVNLLSSYCKGSDEVL